VSAGLPPQPDTPNGTHEGLIWDDATKSDVGRVSGLLMGDILN